MRSFYDASIEAFIKNRDRSDSKTGQSFTSDTFFCQSSTERLNAWLPASHPQPVRNSL